jgi:hypothetical protein
MDTDREGSRVRSWARNTQKDPNGDRGRDREEEAIEEIGTGSGLLFSRWRGSVELPDLRFCGPSGLTHRKTVCQRNEMTFRERGARLGAS